MTVEPGRTPAASSTSAAATDGPAPHQPSIDPLPGKRSRRSNPKVKTGCITCKQRRIKCDERRPACTQCVRSNKSCRGYPSPRRSDGPVSELRIAPRPIPPLVQCQPASEAPIAVFRKTVVLPPRRANRGKRLHHHADNSRAVLATYQPSNGLSLPDTEALYFDLFRLQTASELSGYFNSSFWGQRVLQECHSEAAIRHAVVALGALYKTLDSSSQLAVPVASALDSSHRESIRSHWRVAVKQYSEACNAMLLLHGENLENSRTRLMASVLLACFDSFIGDHKQAIVQIQTGLGLLERLHDTQPQCQSPGRAGYVEEDLVVIFTRLAVQAKSYDMAFHFPQPYVIRLSPQGQRANVMPTTDASSPPEAPIPFRFGSVLEARLASDKLCEKLVRFIERMQIAKNDPSNVLPASWRVYGLRFQGQMDAWAEAFEPIFRSRLSPGLGHLERSGISTLKMFQVNTNILFMMMFCDTEMQFDAFLPHFKAIVSLGWEVVHVQEKRTASAPRTKPSMCRHQGESGKDTIDGKLSGRQIKPSFSADMGIVPPLFVVATKCREPWTRRQAIQLLRSSARREGMWDSELTAKIGEWIMQVEEADGQEPPGGVPTKPIPEERRVMVKTVDFDLRARFADVRVGTRALHDGCPDVRSRKTRLTW